LFVISPLQAAHIIGGEITYECLGTNSAGTANRYKFVMRIYRDCQSNGALFDSATGAPFPATVTIYQDGTTLPRIFELGAPIINKITPSSNPCFDVPPNVCVEEGIYEFETELPIISGSYYVVYQRCCRNSTINNITEPGLTGATYTTQITTEAQTVCNTSPTFKGFPPIVLCLDKPIDFDHSATDAEGDSLVYEFCSPLVGGGPNTNNFDATFGVAPNPDAPPPYDNVNFIAPTYSDKKPLGEFANLRIDPETGFITGEPNMLGQFVVAVCMYEYRKGELLSITRRDFQFNVTECEPKVVAQITADSMVNRTRSFFLQVCGTENITFQNESYSRANVQRFFWEFDLQGDTVQLGTWNATVSFPDIGIYTGRLILNPNTECGDTANIFVEVKPEILADFDFEYDTCRASPVVFQDQSFSGSMQLTDWQWTFGDGGNSRAQNPTHNYDEVGEMMVNLRVKDINNCEADTTQIVRYFPVPEEIVIDPSTFEGCNPQFVFFDNLSEPISEAYDIRWDFGDGGTSSAISPDYVYEEPGIYDVSLEIISPVGCRISHFYENWITVRPSPIASFTYNPEQPTIKDPTVVTNNESVNAVSYFWDFSGIFTSMESAPIYTFPDTGQQQITLIATHQSGCQDTAIQFLDIPPEIFIYLPNVFSPNGQGNPENEFFKPVGILPGVRNYRMLIWDRWGNLLFTSNDLNTPWNGTNQSNEPLPQGVYIYVIEFIGPRGESYKHAGDVTILR